MVVPLSLRLQQAFFDRNYAHWHAVHEVGWRRDALYVAILCRCYFFDACLLYLASAILRMPIRGALTLYALLFVLDVIGTLYDHQWNEERPSLVRMFGTAGSLIVRRLILLLLPPVDQQASERVIREAMAATTADDDDDPQL
ncbi:MAG: hypothetical protein WC483_03630 [Candidatus Paceibacterota bacterium]